MAVLLHQWFLLFLLPVFTMGKSNAAATPHPFYISVTEVNHNASAKSLEISCKFFADDFEQTVNKNYNAHLDISAAKDKASFDKFIPDYINKHFAITADGKPARLNYVGYEKEKESTYCYFEVTNMATVKQLDIFNSLLHDFTDQQINIMHITVNGKRQSTKLDYPNTKASFQF